MSIPWKSFLYGCFFGVFITTIFYLYKTRKDCIEVHHNLDAFQLVGIGEVPLGYEWLQNANIIDFWNFRIYSTPLTINGFGLIAIHPIGDNNLPSFIMGVDDSNEILTYMIAGPNERSISVAFDPKANEFLEYDFTLVEDGKMISFIDSNLDGFIEKKLLWGDAPVLYRRDKTEWTPIDRNEYEDRD
jgi:hypothetical protein